MGPRYSNVNVFLLLWHICLILHCAVSTFQKYEKYVFQDICSQFRWDYIINSEWFILLNIAFKENYILEPDYHSPSSKWRCTDMCFFYRYMYDRNYSSWIMQFIKTKVYLVYVLRITFKLFSFPIFWHPAYLMTVI